MRPMKAILALLCLLLAAPANADHNTDARAALALAMAAKRQTVKPRVCSCSCGSSCTCVNGECSDPACVCVTNSDGTCYCVPAGQAKAARALAAAVKRIGACTCGANCRCVAGECGCATCPSRGSDETRYVAAYQAALKEQKPICVWVGSGCSCERDLTEFRHVHVENYHGDATPRIIVAKPDAEGFEICATLTGECSAERIREAMKPKVVVQVQSVPVYRPMPMMMGGFGGGFGGGGCPS